MLFKIVCKIFNGQSHQFVIIFKNVTSDSHFVTVDFPHEVEVSPQSCTAGQVAHISYHCKDYKLCMNCFFFV